MDFTPEQHKDILNLYEQYKARFNVEPKVHRYHFASRDDPHVICNLECRKHQDIVVSGYTAYREDMKPIALNFGGALDMLNKWFKEVTHKFENTPNFEELKTGSSKRENLKQGDSEFLEAIKEGIKPNELKHALSTDPKGKKLKGEKYYNQGIIGYIEKEKSSSNTPLWECYLRDENDYFYFVDRENEKLEGRAYDEPRIIGFISTTDSEETILFHRYYRNDPAGNSDHFYCINPRESEIRKSGYKNEDHVIGKIFLHRHGGNGLEPLYLFSNDKDFKLFEPLSEIDLQSKLDSAKGFWWYNDRDRNWSEDKQLKVGSTVLIQLADAGVHYMGELLLIFDTGQDSLIGIFEIGEVNETDNGFQADLFCNYLYEFQKRIHFNDLVNNNVFSLDEIDRTLDREIVEISRETFNKIITFIEPEDKQSEHRVYEDQIEDNIPFHLDQIEETDRLNREPVAKSIAKLLNQQIFSTSLRKPCLERSWIRVLRILRLNRLDKTTNSGWAKKISEWVERSSQQIHNEKKNRHAFMIHLQGAWGDGKSTFLNLIKTNLNTEKQKWVVVNFNAWQHQHISPPWWSFLDQVYKQTLDQFPPRRRVWLYVREQYRRLFKTTLIGRVLRFLILACFLFIAFYFLPLILEFFGKGGQNTNPLGDDLIALSTILTTLATIAGLFYSVSQFLMKPFFLQSSESAKSFMKQASDPMARIKRHFELLVDNVETSGYRLAIFIDDLDRCSTSFTVQLLEGIQTLYKDRKVLYIIAGDRKWISTCFENNYSGFENIIEEPSQKLGYLFLEKAFQLSVRLPKVTQKVKKEYWDFILDPNKKRRLNQTEEILTKKEERSPEEKVEVKARFREKFDKKQYSSPGQFETISTELGLTDAEATDYALEYLNENQEDIKHRLQDYSDLIEANPRSIKRLANQYNIYRDTLIAERRTFEADKLFRWLILQNCYPNYTDCVERQGKLLEGDNMPRKFKGFKENAHWLKLILGDETRGGKLEIEDIAMFVGREVEGTE